MINKKYEPVLLEFLNYIFLVILFYNNLAALITFLLVHRLVFWLIKKKIKGIKHINIFQIIFLILFIIMMIVSNSYLLQFGNYYFEGGSDDLSFETTAVEISKANSNYISIAEDIFISNRNIQPDHNSKLYIFLISVLVETFGEYYDFYMPRLINIYLLLINAVIIYLILNKIFNVINTKAIKQTILISLLPINIILAVNSFRDTLVLTLILLFYYVVNMRIKNKIVRYLFMFILATMTYWIRKPFILILLIILIIREKKNIFKSPMFILISGIGIMYLFNSLDYLTGRYINHYSNRLNDLSSGGLSNFIFNRDLFPFGFILRFAYGLISPLPSFGNIVEIIIGINTFIITNIYIAILLSYKKIRHRLKFFILWLAQYLAIILTTFGFRHFLFNSIFITLFASSLEIPKKIKEISILINLCFWILLLVMYIVLKI